MRLFKKVLAVSVASMCAVSLAACGGGKSAETTAAVSSESKEESKTGESVSKAVADTGKDAKDIKVGISIYKFDDNFMTLYRNELVRYLTEDCGIPKDNIVVQDGKNDQAEQTNQINNFIATKVDVMILNLVQSSSAPTVTDLAKEAGIPVVLLDVIAELRIHERLIAVGTAVLHVFSPQELFNDSVAEQFFVDVVVVRHTLLRAVTLF